MAEYFDDFSAHSTGSLPASWTELYEAASVVATVETGGDDKVLQLNVTTGSRITYATLNAVDSDADADDCEVVAQFQVGTLSNATGIPLAGVVVRATSGGNCYAVGPRTSTQLRLASFASGSPTSIASATISTLSTGTWYWIRFRANGTTLQARIWADGASEPGTWDINTTNGTYSAADSAGVLGGASTAADPIYELVGIGTNGDAAPVAAPGGGGYTLTLAAGTYSVTGNAAALKVSRKLSAAAGSYAVTGQAATLRAGRKLTAVAGSYAATGQAATLRVSRVLALAAGAYALTGAAASLSYTSGSATYSLTLDAGSYTLTGQSAAFAVGRKLVAAAGSYTVDGKTVSLSYSGSSSVIPTMPPYITVYMWKRTA